MLVTDCSSKFYRAVSHAALVELTYVKWTTEDGGRVPVDIDLLMWGSINDIESNKISYSTREKSLRFFRRHHTLFKTICDKMVETNYDNSTVYSFFETRVTYKKYWNGQRDPLMGLITACRYFLQMCCVPRNLDHICISPEDLLELMPICKYSSTVSKSVFKVVSERMTPGKAWVDTVLT